MKRALKIVEVNPKEVWWGGNWRNETVVKLENGDYATIQRGDRVPKVGEYYIQVVNSNFSEE